MNPLATMTARRAVTIWSVLGALALAVFIASLALGSVRLGPLQVIDALTGGDDGIAATIVRSLRLPRALGGFACGALLAVAGALLQVLLRNPLADPYVLGVSGGAATFALAAMMLTMPWWGVSGSAFLGALVSIGLVLAFARRELSRTEPLDASPRLLLTGVVMASGWYALITLLLTIAPEGKLRGMLFWIAGDLNGVEQAWLPCIALVAALAASVPVARQLNLLLRGETFAVSLGVAAAPLRLRIYLIASLATAAAVTTGGTVGFVGLVVPHAIRLAFGNDQRMLLPAAALLGGTVVMAADLLARSVVAPAQLPVGVITALLGVPVFLWILLRRPA